MGEYKIDSDPKRNLEGEHLTGGPSLKQWLLILAAIMVLIGVGVARMAGFF